MPILHSSLAETGSGSHRGNLSSEVTPQGDRLAGALSSNGSDNHATEQHTQLMF